MDDNQIQAKKMETLMALIKTMKDLQGSDPKALEVQIHSEGEMPEGEMQEGDEHSPMHEAQESPEEEDSEHDDQGEMQIPEGLMRLLQEKLSR